MGIILDVKSWEFYALSNGSFYMAPDSNQSFQMICENGFEEELSEDALDYCRLSVCLQSSIL